MYVVRQYLLYLDPGDSELTLFIHLHSDADFIYAPRVSSNNKYILNCLKVNILRKLTRRGLEKRTSSSGRLRQYLSAGLLWNFSLDLLCRLQRL